MAFVAYPIPSRCVRSCVFFSTEEQSTGFSWKFKHNLVEDGAIGVSDPYIHIHTYIYGHIFTGNIYLIRYIYIYIYIAPSSNPRFAV